MYTVWLVDSKKSWHLCHGGDNLDGALRIFTAKVIRHGFENVRLFQEMTVRLNLTAVTEYCGEEHTSSTSGITVEETEEES